MAAEVDIGQKVLLFLGRNVEEGKKCVALLERNEIPYEVASLKVERPGAMLGTRAYYGLEDLRKCVRHYKLVCSQSRPAGA